MGAGRETAFHAVCASNVISKLIKIGGTKNLTEKPTYGFTAWYCELPHRENDHNREVLILVCSSKVSLPRLEVNLGFG